MASRKRTHDESTKDPGILESEEPTKIDEPKETKPPREFGLGHIKGGPLPDQPIRAKLGAPSFLPSWATLLDCIPEIRNQGSASSCGGVRLAQNIDIRFIKQHGHRNFVRCSGSALYAGGRMMEHPSEALPIFDVGSMPGLILAFAQKHGIPREDLWPYIIGQINERPTMDVLDAAFTFPLAGAYVIDGEGVSKVRDVMHAIANGHPVAAGTQWTREYDETDGKELLGPARGESLGDHYTGLVHYETKSDGTTKFKLLNQYGPNWADGGFAWVSDEAVASFFEMIVVEAVPREWAS